MIAFLKLQEVAPILRTFFDVDSCERLHDESIESISSNCKSLEVLGFASCRHVTDNGLLVASGMFKQLCSLDVSKSHISDVAMCQVAESCKETLETVFVSGCSDITSVSISYLLENCKKLSFLQTNTIHDAEVLERAKTMFLELEIVDSDTDTDDSDDDDTDDD